ncbi:hypothetical protein Ql52_gp010 [Caulobacter phage Quill_5.2]|uniref:Uncharacterized protein n=1 Tax=Caulobacter phage Quill_5.2 TaxID=3075108 RepID=A0AA96PQU8_9CAUD|nr:hypothetical protein Ql52_gp010 [Caulobacter phage Quill_5.2]
MTDQVQAEAKAPKTTAQRLEAAKALVVKLTAQLAQEIAANDVRLGDTVKFEFGRGEKRRTLSGVVSARKEAETDEDGSTTPVLLKVDVGVGFDATSYKLRISEITENVTAAERNAEDADANPLSED